MLLPHTPRHPEWRLVRRVARTKDLLFEESTLHRRRAFASHHHPACCSLTHPVILSGGQRVGCANEGSPFKTSTLHRRRSFAFTPSTRMLLRMTVSEGKFRIMVQKGSWAHIVNCQL